MQRAEPRARISQFVDFFRQRSMATHHDQRHHCHGKSQVTVVLGAQWGDEGFFLQVCCLPCSSVAGKGKLVDVLGGQFEYCVRFNGGLCIFDTGFLRSHYYARIERWSYYYRRR